MQVQHYFKIRLFFTKIRPDGVVMRDPHVHLERNVLVQLVAEIQPNGVLEPDPHAPLFT